MALYGFSFSGHFIAMKNEVKTIKDKQQKTTEIYIIYVCLCVPLLNQTESITTAFTQLCARFLSHY